MKAHPIAPEMRIWLRTGARSLWALLLVLSAGAEAQNLATMGKTKPVRLSGNLSAGMNTYHTNASTNNLEPFQWSVTGTPVLSIYGVELPFQVFLSSRDKSFNTPFTRFGLSPYYKWAKLYIGWQSLHFNEFTLGGQQMLGGGFELTPGKFQVAFMYGRLNHAITDISQFNNLNNNAPVYNRNAYAVKLGFGTHRNNISFSYLQAKDRDGSADPQVVQQTGATPAANQAIGLKGQLSFLKHFTWRAEGAMSFYTRDTRNDSVGVANGFDNNLFVKGGVISNLNASSSYATAAHTSLAYSLKGFSLALQYRRVDPGYKSMGAFYLQTDIEQYTIAPSFRLFKNKLFINGSIGFQHNNLDQHLRTNSRRTIGMVNLSWSPGSAFGLDVQYSNYGISQQVLTSFQSPNPGNPNLYDSVRISEVSQSVNIAPHLTLVGKTSVQVFSLNAGIQNLEDNNDLNKGQSNYTTTTATFSHDWQLTQSNWDINQSVNYINTKMYTGKTGSAGYTLAIAKAFVRRQPASGQRHAGGNRLALTASGSYYISLVDNKSQGSVIAVNGGLRYRFLQKHGIAAGIGTIDSHPKTTGVQDRKELTTYIRYNFSF